MNDKTIKAMTSTGKDDWETPSWLFEQLDREFHFTLDPCSTHENAKCEKHYTAAENGLLQDWGGKRCSAIRRTHAEIKTHGWRNARKRAKSREQSSWHCCQHGRIPNVFTAIFMAMRRSDFYKVVYRF